MTICKKCKYLVKTGGRNISHNWKCSVVKPEKEVDPLDGEEKYAVKNDLGHTFFVDKEEEAFEYCRRKNDGNCSDFELGTLKVLK